MLVTFRTEAHENITMFGDVAQRLLQLMGHSGHVPSALTAEEVPRALQRLELGIAHVKNQTPPPTKATPAYAEEDDDTVSLAHRAVPLLELLRAAAKQQATVLWE